MKNNNASQKKILKNWLVLPVYCFFLFGFFKDSQILISAFAFCQMGYHTVFSLWKLLLYSHDRMKMKKAKKKNLSLITTVILTESHLIPLGISSFSPVRPWPKGVVAPLWLKTKEIHFLRRSFSSFFPKRNRLFPPC